MVAYELPQYDDDENPDLEVEYEIDGHRMRAKGKSRDVAQHTVVFARMIGKDGDLGFQMRMPERALENNDAPMLRDTDASETNASVNGSDNSLTHNTEIPDLPTFYLNKAPDRQIDQIAVIIRWQELTTQQKIFTKAEIEQAFDLLKPASVRKPDATKLKDMINNATKRDLLYREDRGAYGLTIQGRNYVDAINSAEE